MAEKGSNCGINKTIIMATNITVPDIGDFENVEIIEILVKPGDLINKNDPIVTLESDKSSVEVPSPFVGKISSVKVKIGDKVSKGSVLAVIESEEVKTSAEPIKEKKEKTKQLVLKKEISKKEEEKKVYARPNGADIDPVETQEWLDSLDAVMRKDGSDRTDYLLKKLIDEAYKEGSHKPLTRITPYINTIPPNEEVKSPGDQNIERRIRSLIRWNAAAMVVKANKKKKKQNL